jgi:hypothetical protein
MASQATNAAPEFTERQCFGRPFQVSSHQSNGQVIKERTGRFFRFVAGGEFELQQPDGKHAEQADQRFEPIDVFQTPHLYLATGFLTLVELFNLPRTLQAKTQLLSMELVGRYMP